MADQTYDKIDLATEQLDDAISLFLKKHFGSALVLAGAAEETLSKALSHRGEQDALERKREALEPLNTWLHGRSLSREEFIRDENRALIAITHMESASDLSVTLDLEEAAYSMIVRACEDSDLLGLPRTRKMRHFENWFYEHVVGDMVGDVA
jgi:hypothetical protein